MAQALEVITATIDTQGDTSTATRVKLGATSEGVSVTDKFAVRVKICNMSGVTDSTNATIAVDSGYGTVMTTNTSDKDYDIASMTASATGTLTVTGVVDDGETVTLGSRVYEFDHDGSYTGDISIDISSYATASQGTLTMDTQPTALDGFEIGGTGYIFVADGTENRDGEISVGADLAAAKVNLVAAINGTDGNNTAHTTVSAAAFSGNDCVITAATKGTAGDAITTTENFTAGTNVFDAVTLGTTTAGVDCTAANAVTALVTGVNADGSAEVTVTDATDITAQVETVTTVADVSDSLDGTYFQLSDEDGTVGVWFDTDDSGTTIPAGASALDRALECTGVVTNDTAASVATALATTINADSKFSASADAAVVTVTHATGGAVGDGADGDAGFSFAVTTNGLDDTMGVTSDTAGYDGDSIASTETMTNGAFGAATLSGAAVINEIFVNVTDGTAETVTLCLGEPAALGLAVSYAASSLNITHAAP